MVGGGTIEREITGDSRLEEGNGENKGIFNTRVGRKGNIEERSVKEQ